jgi:hypothetical protein
MAIGWVEDTTQLQQKKVSLISLYLTEFINLNKWRLIEN